MTFATGALSQAPAAPTGAPPPEAKPIVEGPKKPADAPTIEDPLDGTTASVSMGGMLTTGNSRNIALSANGNVETRFGSNGLGASLLGNYARGASQGEAVRVTTENVQGRVRYDRYLTDPFAVFLLNTGRHDRFQGLDFRYNLDPGVKYLFLREATNLLWGELGYDLQHDIRRDDARLVTDASGNLVQLDKTQTDHSSRLFVGYKRGFNKEVTLAASVEYLQSFVDIDRARLNFDALLAAKLVGGLTFGFGFSARFDNLPLAGKAKLDTASTLSLVYAYSDVRETR
jgi:hypothetical protein